MSADNLPRPDVGGPWGWYDDGRGCIELRGYMPGDGQVIVMDPVRRGMQGATVRFSVGSPSPISGRPFWVMRPAHEMATLRHAHRGFGYTTVDNPNARAIEALPEWIDAHDAAVAERDALARRVDAVRALCDEILSQPPDAGRTWAAREVRLLLEGEDA